MSATRRAIATALSVMICSMPAFAQDPIDIDIDPGGNVGFVVQSTSFPGSQGKIREDLIDVAGYEIFVNLGSGQQKAYKLIYSSRDLFRPQKINTVEIWKADDEKIHVKVNDAPVTEGCDPHNKQSPKACVGTGMPVTMYGKLTSQILCLLKPNDPEPRSISAAEIRFIGDAPPQNQQEQQEQQNQRH